jgi:hypothetical protein
MAAQYNCVLNEALNDSALIVSRKYAAVGIGVICNCPSPSEEAGSFI